jgi:hypothetical protein
MKQVEKVSIKKSNFKLKRRKEPKGSDSVGRIEANFARRARKGSSIRKTW